MVDGQGRVTTRGAIGYGYDGTSGRVTSMTSTASNTSDLGITYETGMPKTITWLADPNQIEIAGSVTFDYNARLQIEGITVGGETVTFTPDADGLIGSAGDLDITTRDDAGAVLATTLDQITDTYVRNQFGEPLSYTAVASGTTQLFAVAYVREHPTPAPTPPAETDGRILELTETIQGTTTTRRFTYDASDRLEDVYEDSVQVAHYEYDPNGNRITGTYNRQGAVTAATYDDSDQLVSMTVDDGSAHTYSFTYADDGSLATKTVDSQTTTYDYDEYGNLRTVVLPSGKRIEYLIDAANRRVGRKVSPDGIAPATLEYGLLYQDQLNPVAVLDADQNVAARFVYGTKANVPDYMVKLGGADAGTYRIISDHLGSVRLVVRASNGTVVQQMDYDEWGNVLDDTAPGFQPFGFAGGIYDRDTRLVHFGAREYDPQVGRWTTRDPIRFGGGVNLYLYVGADPINRIDPSGLKEHCVALGDPFVQSALTVWEDIGIPIEELISAISVAEERCSCTFRVQIEQRELTTDIWGQRKKCTGDCGEETIVTFYWDDKRYGATRTEYKEEGRSEQLRQVDIAEGKGCDWACERIQ